jgi:hypothetical protein
MTDKRYQLRWRMADGCPWAYESWHLGIERDNDAAIMHDNYGADSIETRDPGEDWKPWGKEAGS